VTALAVASFLAFGALLVLFGANSIELIAHLDLDYSDLGLLGSMLSLGLGVGIIVAGPISDRLPRRPLYIISCLLVLVATTTLGADTDYRSLLLHTLVIGFGAGFYETVLNALIVEEFGERAPRRLVFVHSAATLAASATPLLFEFARTITPLAWYDTFRIVGGVHALLILSVAFVSMRPSPRLSKGAKGAKVTMDADAHHPGEGGEGPDPSPAAGLSLPPANDRVALAAICLATFAYVGVESALTLFVADHATSELGLDAAHATRSISAFWGGLLVGRLAIGLSPRRVGAGTTAALAAIGAAIVSLFGFGWIGVPELAMAGVGFCLGGVFPIMIGLAGMALPTSAGTAVGLAGGLGSLGGFVVPWLTGRIATTATGGLSIALASLGAWLGVLVVAAALTHHRQQLRRSRRE
jgi:FHS family glucose/mannose:H+ symporter-like MFS transporter